MSEFRLTAGCVLMDLASLPASQAAVYASGLNAKLNSICHLLALLGARPIFHVSRIRVNAIYSNFCFRYPCQTHTHSEQNVEVVC